jgi:uroporphyrinogen-III synthase
MNTLRSTNAPGCLDKRRIVITRSQEQNTQLAQALQQHGAQVLEIPLIGVTLGQASEATLEVLDEMGQYEWLVFTSSNGVHGFMRLFFQRYADIRSVGGAKIACVGSSTAQAVRSYHLDTDLIPAEQTAAGLAEALLDFQSLEHVRILVITGNLSDNSLPEQLSAQGKAIVDTLPVYQTESCPAPCNATVSDFRQHGADVIVFASPSAVRSFCTQAGALQLMPGAQQPAVGSLGPSTTQEIKRQGIPLAFEAAAHSLEGLVQAVCDYCQHKAPAPKDAAAPLPSSTMT